MFTEQTIQVEVQVASRPSLNAVVAKYKSLGAVNVKVERFIPFFSADVPYDLVEIIRRDPAVVSVREGRIIGGASPEKKVAMKAVAQDVRSGEFRRRNFGGVYTPTKPLQIPIGMPQNWQQVANFFKSSPKLGGFSSSGDLMPLGIDTKNLFLFGGVALVAFLLFKGKRA